MRQALNDNPLVQIGLLGVMAVLLAAVFLLQAGGGGEESPTPTAGADPAAESTAFPESTASPESSASPDSINSADSSATGSATANAAPPSDAAPVGIEATEGLPASFAKAYEGGDPVAIFVLREKLVSDKVIAGYAKRLSSEGNVQVFEIDPSELSKWVRVIGPVGIDRTPALVMVAPKNKDAIPTASVSYGFRNYESVRQAVVDARYDGPVRGYDPG